MNTLKMDKLASFKARILDYCIYIIARVVNS
jgi:hypothetical protein